MATAEAPLREILKSISFTQLPFHHTEPFYQPEDISRPQLHLYRQGKTRSATPTFDPECLRVLCLLKFADHQIDLKFTHEPDSSPNNRLPFLLLPDGSTCDNQHIDEYLEGSIKTDLKDEVAYLSMVQQDLAPMTEYLAWVESKDTQYFDRYPLVIRHCLGWIQSARVVEKLKLGMPEYGAALDCELVYENALRCLDTLQSLLGDRQYLSNAETPGRLDAWVFACLTVALEAPAGNPVKQAVLQKTEYKGLLDLVLRIQTQYFEPAQ